VSKKDKIRSPKPDDQEMVEEGFNAMKRVLKENPQIEPSLWVSVCLSCIVESYVNSGISYTQFKKEMESAVAHYKEWWEEEEKQAVDHCKEWGNEG